MSGVCWLRRFAGLPGIVAFDLDCFLSMAQRSRKWQDPHTLRNVTVKQLQLDTWMQAIIDRLQVASLTTFTLICADCQSAHQLEQLISTAAAAQLPRLQCSGKSRQAMHNLAVMYQDPHGCAEESWHSVGCAVLVTSNFRHALQHRMAGGMFICTCPYWQRSSTLCLACICRVAETAVLLLTGPARCDRS